MTSAASLEALRNYRSGNYHLVAAFGQCSALVFIGGTLLETDFNEKLVNRPVSAVS
jgi:hypothetical protein